MDSNEKYQLNIYQVNYPLPYDQTLQPVFEIKGDYSNMHPSYDYKNQWLYFSSDRPGGYGGMDLYRVRFNQDGIIGNVEKYGY